MTTYEKLKKIVLHLLNLDINEFANDEQFIKSKFVDDLGADSLDLVEIVMAIEETFDIDINDVQAEKLTTVGETVDFLNKTLYPVSTNTPKVKKHFPVKFSNTKILKTLKVHISEVLEGRYNVTVKLHSELNPTLMFHGVRMIMGNVLDKPKEEVSLNREIIHQLQILLNELDDELVNALL